jgi:hypothetical protein
MGEQDEQPELLTLDQRVKREVLAIFGRHDRLTPDGRVDLQAIADDLYPVVKTAVVDAPKDRFKHGISKIALMERFYPEVPTLEAAIDEPDPDLARGTFNEVKNTLWKVCSTDESGAIQAELSANGGYVLCQHGPRDRAVVYVTRNRKCIQEDLHSPAVKAAIRAELKAAALTALAIDRVPEAGAWFASQYKRAMKDRVDSGSAIVKGAIAANSEVDDVLEPDVADEAIQDDE